jgi:disulfide oxidoreductase YuzD
LIRVEMERRFGDSATIDYIDVNAEGSRETHRESVEVIQERGLIYPVTMIEGSAMYDGAVSYPAILRAVETVLAERVQ